MNRKCIVSNNITSCMKFSMNDILNIIFKFTMNDIFKIISNIISKFMMN